MSPPFPQRQVFILLTDEALAQEGAREMNKERPRWEKTQRGLCFEVYSLFKLRAR